MPELDYFFHPENILTGHESPCDLSPNTIIVPCAFGRNTWEDKEVARVVSAIRYKSLYNVERFQELKKLGFEPGLVNRALAEICFALAQAAPSRIWGQWEVMYAFYELDPVWYESQRTHFRFQATWPDGSYLSTREVLRSVLWRPTDRMAIVAQAVHAVRCFRIARHLYGPNRVMMAPGTMPHLYDPDSVQPWTRSEAAFLGRERWTRPVDEALSWTIRLGRLLGGK